MKHFKLSMLLTISRTINGSFRSIGSRFVSLSLIGGIVYIASSDNMGSDILLLPVFALFLSLSVKRVSDNFILSLLTGHLSMSLKTPEEYRCYNYKEEKEKISEKLKEDFVLGILNASRYRTTLRFSTHGWFVKTVISDNRIRDNFEVIVKKKPKKTIVLAEVLSLFTTEVAFADIDFTLKQALKKRSSYGVVLKLVK